MSGIIVASLLLIILVDNFDHGTASPHGFHASKVRTCGCRVFPGGKIKCRSPLIPTNHIEKQDRVKCLCSKINLHNFPAFQEACSSWRLNIPLTFL